ncbi:MAG: DUF5677 domain-containing protein [Thermodesulfobacteriota bacterium]
MNTIEVTASKYSDLFDFAKTAIDETPKFLTGENANTTAKQVTLLHLVRAGYLLDATYRLCTQGLATEAMVILRSLLNLFIDLKWMTSNDAAQRFQRYADFEVVFNKLTMQTIIDQGGIWDDIKDDDLTIHDPGFESIKQKYCLKKKKDFLNWSGNTIFMMASEKGVDLEKDYRIIYGRLSSIEHTGPDCVRQYLDDSEKGVTKIKAGPRDENIDLVLVTALGYYFDVKAIAHNVFHLDWPNIHTHREEFSNLQRKYWGGTDRKELTAG